MENNLTVFYNTVNTLQTNGILLLQIYKGV